MNDEWIYLQEELAKIIGRDAVDAIAIGIITRHTNEYQNILSLKGVVNMMKYKRD